MRRRQISALAAGLFWTAMACSQDVGAATTTTSGKGDTMSVTTSTTVSIHSDAFAQGQPIPRKHTGEGEDLSPALSWSGVPEGTKELALICDDPDAPRKEPWVHWVIYKLPAGMTSLKEGVPQGPTPAEPAGATQGKNDMGKPRYNGPMPPPGKPHRYYFKLYALDQPLDTKPGLTKTQLLQAMQGHILAQGELMGTYKR